MSPNPARGLPEALERAATALPADADGIRPANGDPAQLARGLAPAAAGRVLGWLLVHEPEAGAELADAWAEDPGVSPEPLLGIDAETLPKAGRKALRRAHHRLRSRGVPLPQAQRSGLVAKLPPLDDALEGALVSPIDPRGALVAYLVEDHPAGGARLFEVMLDEERGVVECEVYSAGRSKVRKFLRDFTQRDRFPAAPAPPEAVRALVARIATQQPADRPLPRAFTEFRSHLARAPEGTASPGGLARAALAGGEETPAALLERAAGLLQEGRIGPWPPGASILRAVADRLAQLGESRIVVSGPARREQVAAALAESAREVFAGAFARATANRFEESAYGLWKGGSEADARACLAAADAFRAGDESREELARVMLGVVLRPLLQQLDKEEGGADGADAGEQGSLIVKP